MLAQTNCMGHGSRRQTIVGAGAGVGAEVGTGAGATRRSDTTGIQIELQTTNK